MFFLRLIFTLCCLLNLPYITCSKMEPDSKEDRNVLVGQAIDRLRNNRYLWSIVFEIAKDVETVKLLFETGGKLVTDETKLYILKNAISHGHLDSVKFIMENRHVPIDIIIEEEYSLLGYASYFGKTNIVSWFIEKKFSAAACGKFNRTPLHYAVFHGHLETVQFLVDKVDIHAVDANNLTALDLAVKLGNVDIEQILLQKGAQLRSKL